MIRSAGTIARRFYSLSRAPTDKNDPAFAGFSTRAEVSSLFKQTQKW